MSEQPRLSVLKILEFALANILLALIILVAIVCLSALFWVRDFLTFLFLGFLVYALLIIIQLVYKCFGKCHAILNHLDVNIFPLEPTFVAPCVTCGSQINPTLLTAYQSPNIPIVF